MKFVMLILYLNVQYNLNFMLICDTISIIVVKKIYLFYAISMVTHSPLYAQHIKNYYQWMNYVHFNNVWQMVIEKLYRILYIYVM